jgi:VanZ family protein
MRSSQQDGRKPQLNRNRSQLAMSASKRSIIRRLLRGAFWAALACLLALTLLPIEAKAQLLNDKAEHFLAFFALAILGIKAWGRKRTLSLAIELAAVGAGIELLQALPIVGRDAEFLDWVADVSGIIIGVIIAVLLQVIARRTERSL